MTFNSPRDPRIDTNDPSLIDRRPSRYGGGSLLPLLLAAAIAVAIIAMFYPRSAPVVSDSTHPGPSMAQPVEPTPSTAPTVAPAPVPSDPRPTQAPTP
jgi:hypothetical protein